MVSVCLNPSYVVLLCRAEYTQDGENAMHTEALHRDYALEVNGRSQRKVGGRICQDDCSTDLKYPPALSQLSRKAMALVEQPDATPSIASIIPASCRAS